MSGRPQLRDTEAEIGVEAASGDGAGCERWLTINSFVALEGLEDGETIAWLSAAAHNQAEGIARGRAV